MSSIFGAEPNTSMQEDGVRFGRTLVRGQCRDWETSGFDVVVMPNNQRGLTGVNFAGRTRIDGGLDVEREAMSYAPMTLGTSVVTGAGTLTEFGVRHIVHAIVSEALGDPPRELQLRQAMLAAMQKIESIRGRQVLLLPLGSGNRVDRVDRLSSIPMMIEEMIGHLRRVVSRIETIAFLCNSPVEAETIDTLLMRMRRDWWRLRG